MKAIIPAWQANSLSHNWFNEFDQMFESLFDVNQRQTQRGFNSLDLEESEKFILLSIDLPGIKEEDINMELKESVLTISGERKRKLNSDSSRQFSGRRYGKFKQSFRIPKNIDQEKIEADLSDGVLKLLLPKTEAARPKKVELKSKKGGFLSDLLGSTKQE